MTHARRKLYDLHVATQSPIAEQALKWFAALYAVEKAGKDLDADARQQLVTQMSTRIEKPPNRRNA